MKCQILLSGKNKKNSINLSSAELAQRVVKVRTDIQYKHCGQICLCKQCGLLSVSDLLAIRVTTSDMPLVAIYQTDLFKF